MTKAEAVLSEARDKLYLRVRGRNTSSLEHTHFSWCKENNLPYLKIWERSKYASVSLNTDTTSYVLSEAGRKRLVQLAQDHGIKAGNVAHSATYFSADNVLNEQAGALAVEMISIYEASKESPNR